MAQATAATNYLLNYETREIHERTKLKRSLFAYFVLQQIKTLFLCIVFTSDTHYLWICSILQASVSRGTSHTGASLFVTFCAFSWPIKSVAAAGRPKSVSMFRSLPYRFDLCSKNSPRPRPNPRHRASQSSGSCSAVFSDRSRHRPSWYPRPRPIAAHPDRRGLP